MLNNCQGHLQKAPFDPNFLCIGDHSVNVLESFSCDVSQNEYWYVQGTTLSIPKIMKIFLKYYITLDVVLELNNMEELNVNGSCWKVMVQYMLVFRNALPMCCSVDAVAINFMVLTAKMIIAAIFYIRSNQSMNFLVQPGVLLHIEMNAYKSFITLCWDNALAFSHKKHSCVSF